MQVTEFYQKILGLEAPWEIEEVAITNKGKKVSIEYCRSLETKGFL